MWKTLMDGADIGKPAAGAYHGKGRARLSTEEEQASRFFCGVRLLLLVGVNVIENGFSGGRLIDHIVDCINHCVRVNIAVVGQQRSDVLQRQIYVITPTVQREDKLAEALKRRMVYNVTDRTTGFQMHNVFRRASGTIPIRYFIANSIWRRCLADTRGIAGSAFLCTTCWKKE